MSTDALSEGWAEVIATRDASPPDCPCRAATAPLIAAWLGRDPRDRSVEASELQWSNLRKAQHAQRAPGALAPEVGDFAIDVRTAAEVAKAPREGAHHICIDELADRLAEVPLKARIVVYCASGLRAGRAVHMLRERGYHACNGHEPTCEIPEEPTMKEDPRTGATAIEYGRTKAIPSFRDPKIAGPLDALLGAFGDTAGQAIGQAGKAATGGVVTGASEQIQGEIPKIADVLKGQIPSLVGAGAAAAKPYATGLAGEAGRAAGKGAREGSGFGAVSSAPVVLGVIAVVGAGVAIGYAVSASSKKASR